MNTNGTPERYSEEEKERYIDAVHEADGIVRHACRILSVAPSTFYARLKRWERLREELNRARGDTYSQAVSLLVDAALGRGGDHDVEQQWALEKLIETFSEKVRDGLDWTDKQRTEHSAKTPTIPDYADVEEVRKQLEDTGLQLPEHTDPNRND